MEMEMPKFFFSPFFFFFPIKKEKERKEKTKQVLFQIFFEGSSPLYPLAPIRYNYYDILYHRKKYKYKK